MQNLQLMMGRSLVAKRRRRRLQKQKKRQLLRESLLHASVPQITCDCNSNSKDFNIITEVIEASPSCPMEARTAVVEVVDKNRCPTLEVASSENSVSLTEYDKLKTKLNQAYLFVRQGLEKKR